MPKVMIFEPNPYHNEVLPGIVYYFEKLGYESDVYIREEIFEDNAFCRYDFKGSRIPYCFDEIKMIFSDERMKTYEFIFFSSMEHVENGKIERFLDELSFYPKTKYGVLGLYHSNFLIERFNENELLSEGRLFLISDFQIGNRQVNTLSPVFFGKEIKTHKDLDERKKLLIIGSGSDISTLNAAYFSLSKKVRNKLEITFLNGHKGKKKFNYFKVIYHNLFGLIDKRKRMPSYIKFLDKMKFYDMYQEIEKNDYLLCLISNKSNYLHYFENSTSGIRQLAFGFEKPIIIDEKLGVLYNFTSSSSFFYTARTLKTVLENVSEMKNVSYKAQVEHIILEKKSILENSLRNLQNIIDKIRR